MGDVGLDFLRTVIIGVIVVDQAGGNGGPVRRGGRTLVGHAVIVHDLVQPGEAAAYLVELVPYEDADAVDRIHHHGHAAPGVAGGLNELDALRDFHIALNGVKIPVGLQHGDDGIIVVPAQLLGKDLVVDVVPLVLLGDRARVGEQVGVARMVIVEMGVEDQVDVLRLQAVFLQGTEQILLSASAGQPPQALPSTMKLALIPLSMRMFCSPS